MTWFSQSRVPKVKTSNVLTVETNDQLMLTAMRTGKKQGVWIGKTTFLHVHHAFLHISLPSLHDYNVRPPNFTF